MITKLMDWFFKDSVSVICLMSILCNVYLGNLVINLTIDYNEKLLEEVRKSTEKEVKQQLEPTKQKIDTAVNRVLDYIGGDDEKTK